MKRQRPHRDQVEELRRRLLSQAQFFDDPAAYAAGIEDAIDAVIRLDERADEEHDSLVPAGGWFG